MSKVNMYAMLLGKEDQALFFICPGGTILSVKCPLQEPIDSAEFHIHTVDVTKVEKERYICYNISLIINDHPTCLSSVVDRSFLQ